MNKYTIVEEATKTKLIQEVNEVIDTTNYRPFGGVNHSAWINSFGVVVQKYQQALSLPWPEAPANKE